MSLEDKYRYYQRRKIVQEFLFLSDKYPSDDIKAIRILKEMKGDQTLYALSQLIYDQLQLPAEPLHSKRSNNMDNWNDTTVIKSAHAMQKDGGVAKHKATSHGDSNLAQAAVGTSAAVGSASTSITSGVQVFRAMMSREVCTIEDIWNEWTVGWNGDPSIEHLIQIYGYMARYGRRCHRWTSTMKYIVTLTTENG